MHFKKTLIPEYIFFLVTLAFVIFVRYRFSDMAMERDEGEYAYSAAQILRGGFPYLDFYNMKLPGVYYFYAMVFFFFGKSIQVIRLCVLALTIINCFLIKKINEHWFNERAGWLAAGIYLLVCVGTRTQGLVSNSEHFVLFFYLLTLFSLTRKTYFMAGLWAALCIMMKQQGVILLGFAFLYFCFEVYKNRKESPIFKAFYKPFLRISGGFLIPFLVFLFFIFKEKAFSAFKFFAVDYARHYVGEKKATPFSFEFLIFVANQNEWFWKEAILAGLIALSYLFFKKKTQFSTPYHPVILVLLGLFSYMAVLPGWYYRPHYFLYIHPAIAMLSGYFLAWFYSICKDKALKMVYILLLSVSVSTSIYDQFPEIGKYKNGEFINLLYGFDSFNEIKEIGRILKSNSNPDDKIGQVANEPQLNFYADLSAASGYLYNYPFYEKQPFSTRMLEQFFKEMETNKPRWYVKNLNNEKWFNDNKQRMIDWTNQFEKSYSLRGVVYHKNFWEKRIEWNVFKVDENHKSEAAMLIFERGDSLSLKPLILLEK
jgi:Dolichyl-phosphate-mannose-protein mannosyltransferase